MLSQYSVFVAKVREFQKEGSKLEASIKKAVIYCRDHDILKEALEKHASGGLNMLMTEWNWDDAKQVWFEEGFEEGEEKGIEKGREEGLEQGRKEERQEFIKLLRSGKSLEEIIKGYSEKIDEPTYR
jgi:flagellar biosynthesis/type III secretory pathway protein FliH